MSNFNVMEVPGGKPVYLWNNGVTIEEAALAQLSNLATMPFIHKHIAAMPDTHWGMGSTVGSVFATVGAVIPAAVGVDIGCGMIAAKTNLHAIDIAAAGTTGSVLPKIRAEIERLVPMGRTNNGGPGDRGAWHDVPEHVDLIWKEKLGLPFLGIAAAHPEIAKGNLKNHLGTLGTGNHFIELQLDTVGNVWIMLHSGSRGVGNRIGSHFIRKAKELMTRFHITLPDPDLAYLPKGDQLYEDYTSALHWAQAFAWENRQLMLAATLEAVRSVFPQAELGEVINTHHNYAQFEHHFGKNVLLTRKGAISAKDGQLGIIPGSMGTRSYIVKGLGNPLSFHSCSHGAGRAMSRTEAKKRFTVEDHIKAMEGVEGRRDADVIDETPMAYKDIDKVIEAERDLVTPVVTLKQILVCKG